MNSVAEHSPGNAKVYIDADGSWKMIYGTEPTGFAANVNRAEIFVHRAKYEKYANFECEICCEVCDDTNPVVRTCINTKCEDQSHAFCRNCVVRQIGSSIKSTERGAHIFCCGHAECGLTFPDKFIMEVLEQNDDPSLLVDYAIYKEQKELILRGDAVFCPMPECNRGRTLLPKDLKNYCPNKFPDCSALEFRCHECDAVSCANCTELMHYHVENCIVRFVFPIFSCFFRICLQCLLDYLGRVRNITMEIPKHKR